MPTNAAAPLGAAPKLRDGEPVSTRHARKVMVINGDAQMLELVEAALEAGRYDVVFVQSYAHAYSQIKRLQPHVVILCLHVDDTDGFRVLSMLKLDEDTRAIPVVTCAAGHQGESEEEAAEAESGIFAPKPAAAMN